MKTYTFEQQVNKPALEYILANPTDYELGGVDIDGNEVRSGMLTYYTSFLNSLNEDGKVSIKYSKGKGQCERLWGEQCGITNICRKIRHTIASEYNIDIDMKNCHPTFLQKYCQDNGIECPFLDHYITNRAEVLAKDPENMKTEIISIINGGAAKLANEFIMNFSNEMAEIHRNILKSENKIIKALKADRDENLAGRATNYILISMESKALQAMITYLNKQKVKITSLAFDGLTIERTARTEKNIKKYLTGCEMAIKEQLGCDMIVVEKPMNEGIKLPEHLSASKLRKPASCLLSPAIDISCVCKFEHSRMFETLNYLAGSIKLKKFDTLFRDITMFISNVSVSPCSELFIHSIAKSVSSYDKDEINEYCEKLKETVICADFDWSWILKQLPLRKKDCNHLRAFVKREIKENMAKLICDEQITEKCDSGPFLPEDDIYDFIEKYRLRIFSSKLELADDFTSKVERYVKYILFPECYVVNKGDGLVDIEGTVPGATRYLEPSEEGDEPPVEKSVKLFCGMGPLRKDMSIQAVLPQYKNITFQPFTANSSPNLKKGELNMYQGVQAKLVDQVDEKLIQPILDHIYTCWANESADIFDYILQWFRQAFRHPAEKNGTAIILYGPQGAGKGILLDNFLIPLVYGNKLAISTQGLTPVVQRFNSIVMNKNFICCNEVSSDTGFHETFERLKALITDPTMTIEKKGIDIFQDYPNFLNFIFTTNNPDSVKLGAGDRRYCPLETSSRHLKDYTYFDKLIAACNQTAADHFYTFIYRLEKTRNIKNIPITTLKQDMMVHTITAIERFSQDIWNHVAERPTEDLTYWATIFADKFHDGVISAHYLYEVYQAWCRDNGEKTKSSTLFGRDIKRLIGEPKRARGGLKYSLNPTPKPCTNTT